MQRRTSVWRFVGRATALLLCLLAVTILLSYSALSMLIDRPAVNNPVVGVPPGMNTASSIPPYRGPHPRIASRPLDTYSYPIQVGDVGPHETLYAGPAQYPFYCRTEDSELGQPLVDNQHHIGVPVFKEVNGRKTAQIIGYSKDCLLPTRVGYFYNKRGTDQFFPLEDAGEDIAEIVVNGVSTEFIVRVETGTINRFIYMLAAITSRDRAESSMPEQVDSTLWNQRLIYQFRGGVGIGKVQGRLSQRGLLKRRIEQLRLGYAIAYSTANQTTNHYNIWLAEETAMRVKRQFIARYGEPEYTVGIGGSGGAIQQYLLAQNLPGLLDAAIPLYAYPDMITQTHYVFDCELLEYYFDVLASHNPRWRDWSQRSLIEGLNASETSFNMRSLLYDIALLVRQRSPHLNSGSNECVRAWRGLTPLVNNPKYLYHAGRYSRRVLEQGHWSYWDDMKHMLGTDSQGYARQTWDNVGVQYGLGALQDERLTPEEFLHLNANIGSWKPAGKMAPERYWKLGGIGGMAGLLNFSPWGQHNMRLSPDKGNTPAKRGVGDLQAIEAAYRSGQVFIGLAKIPIIDLRHYLDDALDMHHSFASFSARQRLLDGQGSAENQLIWMTRRPHDPVPDAFLVIERWMENMMKSPSLSVGESRPEGAEDRCYDEEGELIASGPTVWDGDWNQRSRGVCYRQYPPFKDSRMVAGAPISGELFKCQRQTVGQAIESGVYGDIDMRPYLLELQRVFPTGVCDYRLPDKGKPVNLLQRDGALRSGTLRLP
ncbi:hypothetical protein IOQ59_02740 [Pontibacterium sp. N1Y112]|uniref:DUF6351 domain-containing protein n=1 Tax=Pontibacterium sinense TaxID=2781979 RepID=A0A8J7FAR3_9GAMM|nr:DUF6351 family protein [Pontibacterium sinense]MBE9396174.1 hypothetical protein [Pontibacterium sinense]